MGKELNALIVALSVTSKGRYPDMTKLKEYINSAYVEQFVMGLIREYEKLKNYKYPSHEIDIVLNFGSSLISNFEEETQFTQEVYVLSQDDLSSLMAHQEKMLDKITGLIGFLIIMKAEELRLLAKVKELEGE